MWFLEPDPSLQQAGSREVTAGVGAGALWQGSGQSQASEAGPSEMGTRLLRRAR